MLVHPFKQSNWHKIIVTVVILSIAAAAGFLIAMYGDGIDLITAFADSLFYVGTMAAAAYLYWYVIGFMNILQTQILVALAVQIISLGVSILLLFTFEIGDPTVFMQLIPLHIMIGLPLWIILQQWYNIELISQKSANKNKEERANINKTETCEKAESAASTSFIDHISVKDNAKIHIIRIEEITYVQAYGDYVMLHTVGGKYIKELTMKYLENNLPNMFIRIHRSYIVNSDFIVRMELYGKGTYQIRLKTGDCLRASANGYKLIKDTLRL
jgi:hypothetical protein